MAKSHIQIEPFSGEFHGAALNATPKWAARHAA